MLAFGARKLTRAAAPPPAAVKTAEGVRQTPGAGWLHGGDLATRRGTAPRSTRAVTPRARPPLRRVGGERTGRHPPPAVVLRFCCGHHAMPAYRPGLHGFWPGQWRFRQRLGKCQKI